MRGRYNIYSKQPESGDLLTVDCQVVEKETEVFIIMRYLKPNGKLFRLETETIKKGE